MKFKSKFMKFGNLRANMFIFKLAAEDQDQAGSVVMNMDGDIGLYNRGNRTLYHFIESSQPMILGIIINFFVYSFPTLILAIVYFLARVIYTLGYTNSGFGGHFPGFILERLTLLTIAAQYLLIFNKANA